MPLSRMPVLRQNLKETRANCVLEIIPETIAPWLDMQHDVLEYSVAVQDITNALGKAAVFSKLDLLKGYFQVPVTPSDVPKTAITTPFCSFVFHYSTFGLKNSGATFQRMMDNILGHLSFIVLYIDDILIFSENEHDHQEHMQTVLCVLQENELLARQDKCVFGASSVEFLGHVISAEGIQPTQNKVKAITNYPTPTTIKDSKAFLGLVNFYGRFIPMTSHIMAPLTQVQAVKPRKLAWDMV